MLNPARGFNEIDRVIVVFFDAGGDGEDVGVKNNIFGRKADFIHQNAVGAFADFDFALVGIGLPFFVKRHHHRRCAITPHQFGLVFEGFHALFHADGIDHAFALHAAQAGFNHAPFAGINHHRNARNIGFTGD